MKNLTKPDITRVPVAGTASECRAARSALVLALNVHRHAAHAGKCELACGICNILIDAMVLIVANDLCKHPAVQEE